MGQFSVTIYGATGSVLSDIQHTGEQVVPDTPCACCAGSPVDIPDKLAETGLLPAHGFNYHDPFLSSFPKQRLREVAARVMVAMY